MEKINLARLKRCMLMAEQGGELTIGFLGGSISQGSLATGPERCYAYRVFSWWRQAFPRAAFHYVNGGIGGTTSHFGVSRAVSDVLMYQPDVVVVDFSVNDEADTFEMAHNVLKAHGRAVQMLRQYGKQPLTIGYAPTCGMCYPETERPEDIEAARQALFSMQSDDKNWTWNVAWWSDPVLLGHYPEEGLARYEPYLPKITDADMKLIAEPIDVYGQNIYNGRCIRMGADGKAEDVKRCEGFAKTAIDWPVTPEALYWGPKFLYERYHKPIYVTENGLSCHDVVSLDKKVHDPNRIDFLARYLRELSRAADEVDLRGYFQWSLMDNFEWAKGYSERFGLVYVDYRTLERIPKDSAYWYRDVMLSNGEKL